MASAPINLLRGWPNLSLLPRTMLLASSQTALSDPAIANIGLEYAPDQGYAPLRSALASWLGKFYQHNDTVAKADDAGSESEATKRIVISGGASQNLACILQGFTDPVYNRQVWM